MAGGESWKSGILELPRVLHIVIPLYHYMCTTRLCTCMEIHMYIHMYIHLHIYMSVYFMFIEMCISVYNDVCMYAFSVYV